MFHSWIEVTAAQYHESTKCHQIIHFKQFILCYGNSISTCIFFFKKKTRLAQVSSQYTSSVSLTTKWAEQT